jgi:hypothetical protein
MQKIIILLCFFVLLSCEWDPYEDEEEEVVNEVLIDVLGYSDFYNSYMMAVKCDIKNKTEYHITKMRPTFTVYQKYENKSFESNPTLEISIKPDNIRRDVWIVLDTSLDRFYSSCTVDKVLYWDKDEKEHTYKP